MKRLNTWEMAGIVLALCLGTALTSPCQIFNALASFDVTDGLWPVYVILTQGSDGSLYGTTLYGGDGYAECDDGCGTVFKVTTDGTLTSLYSFCSQHDCPDGGNPNSGLVQAVDGNFFGTTEAGGAHETNPNDPAEGTVFKITPAGKLTTLYSFCAAVDCTDGSSPYAALALGTDGNFYGTTTLGGRLDVVPGCDRGCGTIFRISPSGTLTTIHRFGGADGAWPYGTLVQGLDGAFYGTTYAGGANGYGTVFKITRDGIFITLHSFDGTDGAQPYAGLVQATDGNFYGTTYGGGECGPYVGGTIFRIKPTGLLTTVYNFGNRCGAGNFSTAPLVQATDGNLYGTTSEDSRCTAGEDCGTIFEITKTGTLTTLVDFENSGVSFPYGGLVQATNGTLYGASLEGGQYYSGAVYSLDRGLGPFVTFVRAAGKVGETGPILGQGFTGTTSVTINGIQASFTVVSDTYITATVPAGATTGYVTVTTPSGILTSNVPFHVIP
jgi:uncharacterized repeat protein (TIGR03803 family)